MNKKLGLAAFVVSLGIACTPAVAAYTSIFAFGDSLSDAGNLFSETGGKIPLAYYVGGHFSNGPTWVEDLSQMLGLGAMKPFLTSNDGTNYAFGGAQTGITDINPFDPSSPFHIDLPDQISAFNLVDPNPVKGALYTLDIGANDIMNALEAFSENMISYDEVETVVVQAEANTINSVKSLVGLGARSLLFYEVPNLGLTPRFDGTALQMKRERLGGVVQRRGAEGPRGVQERWTEGLYAGHLRSARRDQSRSVRIWLHECERSVLDRQFHRSFVGHGLLAGSVRLEPVSFLG